MRTRPHLAALALAAAALLCAAAPAVAHGDSVHLDVTGQQNGRVSTVATWEDDHDPVTGEFAGTLSATASDGRTVGPWRLVTAPGHPGTYTTREILPTGHWRVTVDCAFPAPGRGERELDVDTVVVTDPASPGTGGPALSETAPRSAEVTSAPLRETRPATGTTAAPVSAREASPGPVHATTSDATTWAAIGTACAAVVLVATGLWLRRHRG
ncbi:hypothetical protein ACFU7Y_08135 [Kitasatospora sp. NPDC057542]|uniref:hypothetical protein n=1 Tax=Streptomycetaceae TaxID=2062 RepID=UPI001CCD46DE|nr:hypothetical protein [Streptomyces sp. LS1784]